MNERVDPAIEYSASLNFHLPPKSCKLVEVSADCLVIIPHAIHLGMLYGKPRLEGGVSLEKGEGGGGGLVSHIQPADLVTH